MKTNINSIDRVIRVVIAAVTAILYLSNAVTGTFGLVLITAGGIILMTSVINFCPIYFALGIDTSKRKINQHV